MASSFPRFSDHGSLSFRSMMNTKNPRNRRNPTNFNQNPARTQNSRGETSKGSSGARDLYNTPSIIGTCPFMCPEKERTQRERLHDLAVCERLDGNPGRSSPSLALKKFCRTISSKDVQPSDVRPLPVLEDTLNYLLKLMYSSELPFEEVHDFIFDRTRSIRQDLSMQNITNNRALWMYEKMVRFHVISHHRLWRCRGDNLGVSSLHHLNMEQLSKSLAALYDLYKVNRNSDSFFTQEAEYRSLYVLLHLNSDRQSTGEPLSLWFSRLSSSVIRTKEMCFVRRVLRSFRTGNYWRFFCTVAEEATFLQFCIIEPYIDEVRAQAVACINYSGYKLHPYPLTKLSMILRMKELDLESFCNGCGLETSVDDAGNKVLLTKQTSFHHPKGRSCCYDFLGMEQFEKSSREPQ